jgi:heme-degrading monooxygenase HmoA
MAILTNSLVPGLTREQYESIAAKLVDKLKTSPGFIAHYACERENGVNVVEIWESAEQHDAWFNESVRPNLPVDVTPEKNELMNKVVA